MRVGLAVVVGCLVVGVGGARMRAQGTRVIGTVPTRDARVTGGQKVEGDQTRLMSSTSVTAYDHTAKVRLERGGDVLVCATSQFHLLYAGSGKALMFGLDRGAMELHTPAQAEDVILTPDIRFSLEPRGKAKRSYNLRMRVTRNGDTCVENAGKKAPVLILNSAFSQASYRVLPGQHVLFEHGDLREVVDNEQSPCGCPKAMVPEHLGANATPEEKAAAEHPFPAAASEGLAPVVPVANSPMGEKQTQVSTTFSYGPGQATPPSAMETPEQIIADGGQPPLPSPGGKPAKHTFGYRLKRFFYRLFHPGESS